MLKGALLEIISYQKMFSANTYDIYNHSYETSYTELQKKQILNVASNQSMDLSTFNIGYDYYTGYFTTARLRHYGIQFLVSNPFNRYNRIDLGFSWHNISYSILQPYTNYAFTEIRYEGYIRRQKQQIEKLPTVPEKGDFDINEVMHSEFFFA